jgi:HK97 family phage major capsid protein
MDVIKKLTDEAAETSNRIEAVRAMECVDADAVAARDLELEGLMRRADDVTKKLSFEQAVAESQKNLRSVVDRCTPAPSAAKVERARVEAVPFRGKLRAFKTQEEAHTVGQWIKASYCNDAHARQWCDDHGVEVRTMSESSNSAGGALVPDVMVANLIRLVDVYSVWASGMQQVPMGSDTVIFPKRVSGVTANWTGENSEISTSDPAVNQVQLVASKLTVGTKVSNEVLADSAIALGDFITEEFATAISAKLEAAAVAGDGTSTYGGVYGLKNKIGSASVHTTGSGRDTWEELVAADFLGALGKLPRYALNGARWYISSVGFALAMQRLDMAAGGRVSVEGGTGLQFAGFPVEITDQTHGTDTDFTNEIIAYFGRPDLAGMFGLRSQFATRVSTERYVEFDQTLFTGVARGTMVWHSVGDSSVAGPIVAIKGA